MKTTADHFWSKVDVRSPDECWPWLAFKDRDGYGRVRVFGRKEVASRAAWEFSNKKDLDGRIACHTCDNPSCCNPKHIYAGSKADNARDASDRGLLGSCPPEMHPCSKLTWAKVKEIRQRFENGESNYRLGFAYGVSAATIKKIRDGKTWNGTGAEREF